MIGRKSDDKALTYDSSGMVIVEEHSPISNVPIKKYSKGKLLGKVKRF